MFPLFAGTHDELIKDADGAYSRLVRLQEGNKVAEEVSRKSEADKSNNNILNLSRRTSFARSSSRHSLSLSFALPYQIPLHESGVEDNGDVESSEVDDKKHQKDAVNCLVKLNEPEVPVLVLGSFAAAIHGLTLPVFGLLLSSSVNTFFKPPDVLRTDSMFWSFLFVGLGIVGLVAMTLQNYLFGIAGGKLIERIRSMAFNKVVHQEISWFDHPSNSWYVEVIITSNYKRQNKHAIMSYINSFNSSNSKKKYGFPCSGAVSARLATDASTARSLVGDNLSLIVQNIATITTGLAIAFTANWILAFVILAVSPLLLLQGYLQTKFVEGFSADAKVGLNSVLLIPSAEMRK